MNSLKDMLPGFAEKAKFIFDENGYLAPIFFGMLDGQVHLFPVSDKEVLSKQILDWIASGKLTEYIIIAEAWMTKFDTQITNLSGRTEIIHVMYCGISEEISYTSEINRGTIPPTLSDWEKISTPVKYNSSTFSARFQGLFLKSKAGQN